MSEDGKPSLHDALRDSARDACADGKITWDELADRLSRIAYMERQGRAEEERYRQALPVRMAEAAARINEACAGLLPEGMRFEWGDPGRPAWGPTPDDAEAVSAEMGIDPAAPMTREQHAEFARRTDERLAGRWLEREP